MNPISRILVLLAGAAVCGCGGSDPNKALKPVDPNMPKLTAKQPDHQAGEKASFAK